jgi:2'-5' RNA ligase
MGDPLILTAALDADSAAFLQRLRDTYFPPRLNIVPAHLTLFHHLPGDELIAIVTDLRARAAEAGPMPCTMPGLRFLGRGVAVEIACPALVAMHGSLAARWRDRLNAQDRQGFRPHVTIQNKVTAADARELFERLGPGFEGPAGAVTGLDLWHYRGGPWERAAEVRWAA